MDTEEFQQMGYPSIATALASAVLEWLLIFMLFIDASFSFLVTKFSRHCKLQVPCLLCSRLDHILGKAKSEFYWDLICHKHKLKISSLVRCHLHENLVDVHAMCESCLFSFATVNKSTAETYRMLVGKLGAEPHLDDHDPLLEDHYHDSSSRKNCFCCNKEYILGSHATKVLLNNSVGSHSVDFDAPLSLDNGQQENDRKEIREMPSESVRASCSGKEEYDPLPHIEYKKVKLSSDSDSEAAFSDNDSSRSLIKHMEFPAGGSISDDLPQAVTSMLRVDESSKSLEYATSVTKSSVIDLDVKEIAGKIHTCTTDPELGGQGSEELNWQQAEVKADIGLQEHNRQQAESSADAGLQELNWQEAEVKDDIGSQELEFQEVKQGVDAGLEGLNLPPAKQGTDIGLQKRNWNQARQENDSFATSDPISFNEFVLPSDRKDIQADASGDTSAATGEIKVEEEAAEEHAEVSATETDNIPSHKMQSLLKSDSNVSSIQISSSLDLGDAYKLAISSKGRQLSGKLLEQSSVKDSSKLSEDLKLLLTQLSAARGFESPLNDISPKISGNIDDTRGLDASSSFGIHMLQKRMSLERNESGLSLDGSIVSEIEGESIVDRLKRQVEHDRKLMSSLYKELEEERNASAVAANQAMAMITRLQEEKAALQMETLQCLRMMEEQAEYDGESLQNANDLITEKDKEIHGLEYELDLYRRRYDNLLTSDSKEGSSYDARSGELMKEQLNASAAGSLDTALHNPKGVETNISNVLDETLQMFEDERSSILKSLKKLEKKLDLVYDGKGNVDMVNGESLNLKEVAEEPGIAQRCGREEQNDLEQIVTDTCSNESVELKSWQLVRKDTEIDALQNEFSSLTGRLEALEAEHSFLEHAVTSLRNGDQGNKLIEEIAFHLGELHRVWAGRRC